MTHSAYESDWSHIVFAHVTQSPTTLVLLVLVVSMILEIICIAIYSLVNAGQVSNGPSDAQSKNSNFAVTLNDKALPWACHLAVVVELACLSDPKSYTGEDLVPGGFNCAGLVEG